MNCNHDCFHCKYDDCVNDEITAKEESEISKRNREDNLPPGKQHKREIAKRWYESNREKQKTWNKSYVSENAVHVAEYQKEYREENYDHIAKLKHEWYERNKQTVENPKKRGPKRIPNSYSDNRKEYMREYMRKRRAEQKAAK